ncbi:MAG: homocysteine methyltransferase [Acidobacteriota bacterium]|nr:homocysteine methyltransferase [Acidobacteriota bacterium]
MSQPDPSAVVDLIDSFRRSKIMFAAVSLGIFDRLAAAPSDVQALAQAAGVNPWALERLLDACVALGLLHKDGVKYSNQPVASAYLCRSIPMTLAGYILYSNRALYPMWGNLEDAVREGSNRWKQTFGATGSLFGHFFATEDAKRDFLAGMNGFGLLSSPRVVAAFDLGRFRRLVDLGGATGHLAIEACNRHPNLRAAVFDLPVVTVVAREYIERAGLLAKIDLIDGDFFTDSLPEADLFSLGRILHDWSEEKIRLLLKKIYDRLPSGGALLIAERLLKEDKTSPLPALTQSLNMLVCTEGKERTLKEYAALLHSAGFSEVEGKQTGSPVDAILATKNKP